MVAGPEAHAPYPVQTTPAGGVTLDPATLLDATTSCIDRALEALPKRKEIRAVACDTFWHSVMGLDPAFEPVTPVLTWADTRSSEAAKRLARRLDERAVHARTGCVLHSSYLPAKLEWLSESAPDTFRRVRYWVSFGEYLYLKLFGELRVSISMASATGLFDQNECRWDADLISALPLDLDQLSPLAEFTEAFTGLRGSYADRWPALAHVPWFLPLGDGACNNVGSGGFCEEWAVAMIGTSGAVRVVTAADRVVIPPGMWTYRVDRRRFVQGGALSDGGNVFAWLTHTLQLAQVAEIEDQLPGLPPDAHGLTILPFLAGERSPDWNPDARAAFVGMTLATTPIDIVRASLESVAYRFGIVFEILREHLPQIRGIIGSGAGLIHSPAWLQIMTDVLGEPMYVSAVPEASSRGAALLVLEAMGTLPDLGAAPAPLGREYRPDADRRQIYRAAMERQRRLYRRLIAGETDAPATQEEPIYDDSH